MEEIPSADNMDLQSARFPDVGVHDPRTDDEIPLCGQEALYFVIIK